MINANVEKHYLLLFIVAPEQYFSLPFHN